MKPRNFYRIVIGGLMIVSGIISILVTTGEAIIGTILLCGGIAFLISGIIRHRRYGDDPESDERSKKIGAYGLSYAWLTGLFFMFGLFWLDYFNVLRLSVQNALSVSILVLALSAAIYQMCLFWKGDVE
jgi:energy-coupling factor transporter transmembrane protein EcfT